jgi:hypothetical protein
MVAVDDLVDVLLSTDVVDLIVLELVGFEVDAIDELVGFEVDATDELVGFEVDATDELVVDTGGFLVDEDGEVDVVLQGGGVGESVGEQVL